jgi:hypothetical protein
MRPTIESRASRTDGIFMAAKRVKPRLKGLSVSVLGSGAAVQWDYGPDERETIRKLVSRLEDRRVLYAPFVLEVPAQVTQSVLAIREAINEAMEGVPEGSEALRHLRLMRGACRKFLSGNYTRIDIMGFPSRPYDQIQLTPGFFVALGELRAVFGAQIAALASVYKLDVEAELAAIFPVES